MKIKLKLFLVLLILFAFFGCEDGLLVSDLEDTDGDGIPDIYETPPPLDFSAMSGVWEYEYVNYSNSTKNLYSTHVYESGNYIMQIYETEGPSPYELVNDVKGSWYYNDMLGEVCFIEPWDDTSDQGFAFWASYDMDTEIFESTAFSYNSSEVDCAVFELVNNEPLVDEGLLKFINIWDYYDYNSNQTVIIDRANDLIETSNYVYEVVNTVTDVTNGPVKDETTTEVTSSVYNRRYIYIYSDGTYEWEKLNYYYWDWDEDGYTERVYPSVALGSGTWTMSGDIISFSDGVDSAVSMEYRFNTDGYPELRDSYNILIYDIY